MLILQGAQVVTGVFALHLRHRQRGHPTDDVCLESARIRQTPALEGPRHFRHRVGTEWKFDDGCGASSQNEGVLIFVVPEGRSDCDVWKTQR